MLFGTKSTTVQWKNHIHYSILPNLRFQAEIPTCGVVRGFREICRLVGEYAVVILMRRNLHASFYLIKKFFWVVCFPRFTKPKNEPRKTPNLAKIIKNQQNNVVLCDNSIFRSLVLILEWIVYEFYGLMTLFEEMTIFLFFQKKFYFLIFQNKIFNKFFLFYFSFEFKILLFRQKEPYNHKIHRQYTVGSQLKICRFVTKTNICWFLMILAKFSIFCQIRSFPRLICGVLKWWETNKLRKKNIRIEFTGKYIFRYFCMWQVGLYRTKWWIYIKLKLKTFFMKKFLSRHLILYKKGLLSYLS